MPHKHLHLKGLIGIILIFVAMPLLLAFNFETNLPEVNVNNAVKVYIINGTELSHNVLTGLQGGSPNEYYHLNQSTYNRVVNYAWKWITKDVNDLVNYFTKSESDARYVFKSGDTINGDLNVSGTIKSNIVNATEVYMNGTLVSTFVGRGSTPDISDDDLVYSFKFSEKDTLNNETLISYSSNKNARIINVGFRKNCFNGGTCVELNGSSFIVLNDFQNE